MGKILDYLKERIKGKIYKFRYYIAFTILWIAWFIFLARNVFFFGPILTPILMVFPYVFVFLLIVIKEDYREWKEED